MLQEDLIAGIRMRVAVVSVGASTFRGQPAGSVDAARTYLQDIDISDFATRDQEQFRRVLKTHTDRMWRALPSGTFGVSRKSLNLFLRDAFYNHYLRRRYGLHQLEGLLEIPIDSVVAESLRRVAPLEAPLWRGIKRLTPRTHARYQEAATEVARSRGIPRVHLDAFLWVEGRNRSGQLGAK